MRLKAGILGLCFLFSTLLLFTQSWAITLSFNPTTGSIGVSDTFSVDVVISDMQNDDLAAFDFNVNFDESVLAFDSYSLGNGLGDISVGDADDWGFGYLGSGVLNLAELSWLWDFSAQPDEFTLATISFSGFGAGNSALSYSDVILGNELGDALNSDLFTGSVAVSDSTTAPVPEPATMLLLGSGLVGLVGARRKFKN